MQYIHARKSLLSPERFVCVVYRIRNVFVTYCSMLSVVVAYMSVGLKRDIVRAQAENETLAAIRDRLDNEGKYAEEQLLKIKVKQSYTKQDI
jgi:hypothetical protein